jgi:hypothetical protein
MTTWCGVSARFQRTNIRFLPCSILLAYSPTILVPFSITTTEPVVPNTSRWVMQVTMPGAELSMAVNSVHGMSVPIVAVNSGC